MVKDYQNGGRGVVDMEVAKCKRVEEVDGVIHICPSAPSPRGPRVSRILTDYPPTTHRRSPEVEAMLIEFRPSLTSPPPARASPRGPHIERSHRISKYPPLSPSFSSILHSHVVPSAQPACPSPALTSPTAPSPSTEASRAGPRRRKWLPRRKSRRRRYSSAGPATTLKAASCVPAISWKQS